MKNYKIYLLIYFFLWIILFEFLLPANNILPKPSIVFLSFSDLWKDYELPVNYLSTITSIYVSLLAAYFLMRFLVIYLSKSGSKLADFIFSLEWFAEFVPGIVIGMLLIYWFPDSEFIEFIFVFATAFTSMLIRMQNEVASVPKEFLYSAASLGMKDKMISRFIKWKSVQPELIKHIFTLHFYIWSMIIAFEFIKGGYGLGSVLRNALAYRDLSALFSTFLIIGLTIYLGGLVIRYLKNKFFSWSAA